MEREQPSLLSPLFRQQDLVWRRETLDCYSSFLSADDCANDEFFCGGVCLHVSFVCNDFPDCVIDGIALDENQTLCSGTV